MSGSGSTYTSAEFQQWMVRYLHLYEEALARQPAEWAQAAQEREYEAGTFLAELPTILAKDLEQARNDPTALVKRYHASFSAGFSLIAEMLQAQQPQSP